MSLQSRLSAFITAVGADIKSIQSGLAGKAEAGQVVHRVLHNGTAYPARPVGATYVEWVGPTAPPSPSTGDTWVNTS